MFAIYNKFRLQ